MNIALSPDRFLLPDSSPSCAKDASHNGTPDTHPRPPFPPLFPDHHHPHLPSMPRRSSPTPRPTPTQSWPLAAAQPAVTEPPRLVPLDLAQAQFLDDGESRQGSSRDLDPVRRTRRRRSQRLDERQSYPSCGDVGNDVLSCYPTDNTTVVQGEWTRYVWNYRYPEYIGYVNLDIYLFHADSDLVAASWKNVPNDSGRQGISVDDQFWGTRGVTGWRSGQNQTMPFYFLAVSAGATLNGGEARQSTFVAVQTREPDFYIQSLASASSAASAGSLSSLSALSSQSVESTRSVISLTPSLSSAYATANPTGSAATGSGGNGSLQNSAGNDTFPKWAIALLAILGTLALAALLLLAWLAAKNLRTRKRKTFFRRSTGSSTPIMAPVTALQTGGPDSASPIANDATGGAAPSFVGRPVSLRRGAGGGSLIGAGGIHAGTDGASTRSAETGPISGQDAAIMASAFRAKMRKPDFATRPEEEGESPEEKSAREEAEMMRAEMMQAEMLKEQLAEEGRDIQSVRSERGVRVYTGTAEDGGSLEDGGGWSLGGEGTPRPGTPRR
ncbi:hypothetical protein BDV93DRAFT_561302 [Ceratobasidium sp. AG-I]|nr:hypothetical protein BDV93DRAFT_561302 [Ceratobasidium sp. AG-I]